MSHIKICLFTDVHLPKQGEKAMDVDTYQNLKKVADRVAKEKPDHLIVAGDICFKEPVRETYIWFKEYLEKLKIPYSCVVGNHDESTVLAEIVHPEIEFNEDTNELYYVKYIKDVPFIFLDTGRGHMSEEQWKWLKKELREDISNHIVMHHPPFFSGVPHMDIRYSFSQSQKFKELIQAIKTTTYIYTGHYHVERTIFHDNARLLITPSCFVQIDDRFEDFKADHTYPCYRNIYMNVGGTDYISTVKYLFD